MDVKMGKIQFERPEVTKKEPEVKAADSIPDF